MKVLKCLTSFRPFAWIAIVLLLLSACDSATEPQTMIDLTLDRPEGSSAELTLNDGRAFIDVTDPRGINGLTARLDQGEWPEEITVLLRLRGLENLDIAYGNYTITTGRSSNDSPDPPLMLSVVDENGVVSQASPSADIYYPNITQTEEGFAITMPAHFFREAHPSFTMHWIDFYRN